MPPLVGVVIDGANAPRQRERLCVIVAVCWEFVVEVVAFLDRPHPLVVAKGDSREHDEVHGLVRS